MLDAVALGYVLPNGRDLFRDVNLSVVPGEAVAIQSPSGTGKSTLLGLLAGVLTPSTGHVSIASSHRTPIAWVLQSLNVLGPRSVLANAALFARLDPETERVATDRATEMLDLLGIGDLTDATARELSGGELQRLTVARALATTRPIILADEPSNQLDSDNAKRVMQVLVTTARTHQRCVVIVTHDRDALPADTSILRLTANGLVVE